jgi:hypothetical protein
MSSPAVSIITALTDGSEHRLLETYQVLLGAQTAWEWLIQLDGPARDGSPRVERCVPDALLSDERVLVEVNGLALGIAATRSRALARASASLLLNADSDDVPTAAARHRRELGKRVRAGDDVHVLPPRRPGDRVTRVAISVRP